MKKHYLIFKSDESFVGFTSIDPTIAASIFYIYIEVSSEDYIKAKTAFEKNKKLNLNEEKTYFSIT